jgi:probable DNA repair protein
MNSEHRDDPTRPGTTVVTATRRLARWLREADDRSHLAAGQRSWEPVDALAWDAWIDRTWRAIRDHGDPVARGRFLSEEQEALLWEQAIGLIPQAEAVLMPAQVAREAREAWSLVAEFGIGRDGLAAAGGSATRYLLQAAAHVESMCRDQEWCGKLERLKQVADSPGLAAWLPDELVVDGLDTTRPLQDRILDAVAGAGKSIVRRQRATEGALAVSRPCVDPLDEIESLATATRGWLERNPSARLGVVFHDLENRRDDVESIFDDVFDAGRILPGGSGEGRPWSLSLGKPLSQWPIIATALDALALCIRPAPFSRMSRLVRSPYVGGDNSELSQRSRLDAWLRSRGQYELSMTDLFRLLEGDSDKRRPSCADLEKRLASIDRLLPGRNPRSRPEEWAELFGRLLTDLGWPGPGGLDSTEYQCQVKWQELLARLAGLGPVSGRLSAAECMDRLRRLAAETIFQPEAPAAPVQVMGLHETAGLTFDALWVAGTHHQAWPRALRPNAMIPAGLQRAHGVPRSCAEAELRYAREKTRSLAGSAGLVCFSWPRVIDDESMRPSPLIAGLPRIDEPRKAQRYDVVIHRSGRLDWIGDYRLPVMANGATVNGGSSAIRSQSACPFRGQARHRLAAESLDAPRPGVAPIISGQIAHLALQWLWQEWGDSSGLKDAAAAGLEKLVNDKAGRACELLLPGPDPLTQSVRELERQKVTARVVALLAQDLTREDFEVTAVEEERSVEFAGVRIKYRVDRVDRLDGDGVLFVDYKTGDAQVGSWRGERPREPQLPLYAAAAVEQALGVAYGCLKVGDEGYVGYAERSVSGTGIVGVAEMKRPPEAVDGWPGLLTLWRERLTALVAEHAEGDARVAPRRESEDCRYCDLSPLCRRHELGSRGAMADD